MEVFDPVPSTPPAPTTPVIIFQIFMLDVFASRKLFVVAWEVFLENISFVDFGQPFLSLSWLLLDFNQ